MPIKMTSAYGGYAVGQIVTLSDQNEINYVERGVAVYANLPTTSDAKLSLDPVTGAMLGVLGPDGLPLYYATTAKSKFYRSTSGPIALASGKGVSCAIGANGNLYAVTNAGLPMVFNGTTKVWTTYGAIPAPPATGYSGARTMFMDSRGYIFMCMGGKGCIYRSIDGGQTYAIVHNFTSTNEDTMSFTEDSLGNLYTHAYKDTAGKSVQLLKSTNSGGTWSNINTAPVYVGATNVGTVDAMVARHIHLVHWCKHRNLLFVSHGDAGSNSPVLVSNDYGATFKAWGAFTIKNNLAGTRQTTIILTDETAVYFGYDIGIGIPDYENDLGLYRAVSPVSATLDAMLATAPARVYKYNPLDGWYSNGGINEFGQIWFTTNSALNYSGKLLVSSDKGATWETTVSTATATGGGFGSFAPSRAYHSEYFTGQKDLMQYGNANDADIFAWRTLPYTRAVTTYDDLALQWASNQTYIQKLYVDVETLPTPNSNTSSSGIANNLASTTRAYGGTKAMRFSPTATGGTCLASWNNTLNGNPLNSEVVLDARFYLELPSFTGNFTLFTLAGETEIYIGGNTAGAVTASMCCAVNWSASASSIDPAIPRNQWFRLRVVVKRHATAGEVTVLIDDRVALRVVGVPTIKDGVSDIYTTQTGINISGGVIGFVDVDPLIVEVANTPPVRTEAGKVS